MKLVPLALAALIAFAGCVDLTEAPASEGLDEELLQLIDDVAASPVVRFSTDKGDIDMVVYTELMPKTGGRFVELVESGFYDGTTVHRVVDDFVIQGGDPQGTGSGGSGQTIKHEWHPDLMYGIGSVGMARDLSLDSGDSQWFITETPQIRLSDPDSETAQEYGTYALFAQVITGMGVVRDIADEATLRSASSGNFPPGTGVDQRPVVPVNVQSAGIVETAFDALSLPPAPVALDDGVVLGQPFNVFHEHAFTTTATFADDPGAASIEYVRMGSGVRTAWALEPIPQATAAYTATVSLREGTYARTLTIDDDAWTDTIVVHPLLDEYAEAAGLIR